MANASTPAERFWAKVLITDLGSCWLWTGSQDQLGYGMFRHQGRIVRAHRWAYEAIVGPIDPSQEIDHVWLRGCRHRNCVNPGHLEQVSHRTNTLRGNNPAAIAARRNSCLAGHAYVEGSYRLQARQDGRQRRVCTICQRIRDREYYAKRKAETARTASGRQATAWVLSEPL